MKKLSQQIIELRIKGHSYNNIASLLNCTKSNVSYVCNKYVKNNQEMREILARTAYTKVSQESRHKARLAADAYYKNKRAECFAYWMSVLLSYENQVYISYMCGLYEGEGNHTGTSFSVSNSDPEIIKKILYFCHHIIKAPIIASLSIHASHDVQECVEFWKKFNLQLDHVYQLDKRIQAIDHSYKENYGTVKIAVQKPLGLRDALLTYSPVLG